MQRISTNTTIVASPGLTAGTRIHRARVTAPRARKERTKRDWSVYLVAFIAAIAGAIATRWSYYENLILAYQDSQSHLFIARRILDNRTPGFVQLGTVWLPVPHILLMPFVSVDALWRTGLAGSLVGLLCLIVTTVCLFLSIRILCKSDVAAWIGVAVLLSNPSLLYIQSTALTEPVLLMTMTASSYFLLRWTEDYRPSSLMIAGFLAALAVGSRYDGWFFVVASTVAIALTVIIYQRDRQRMEGLSLVYAMTPLYTMGLWFLYNWVYFGDPLEFQHGQFSAQAQQQQSILPAKHHLLFSMKLYSYAIADNIGVIILGLGLIGLVVYAASTRSRTRSFISYVFLSPYVFNVLALWFGQSTLQVPQLEPSGTFNIRYGVMILPGVALFIGYLYTRAAAWLSAGFAVPLLSALILLQVVAFGGGWPRSVAVIADGLDSNIREIKDRDAAAYLRAHYDGGGILIDESGPSILTPAGVPLKEYIASWNTQLWHTALSNPAGSARWIVTDIDNRADRVALAARDTPDFFTPYTEVFGFSGIRIYKRTADGPITDISIVPGQAESTSATAAQPGVAAGSFPSILSTVVPTAAPVVSTIPAAEPAPTDSRVDTAATYPAVGASGADGPGRVVPSPGTYTGANVGQTGQQSAQPPADEDKMSALMQEQQNTYMTFGKGSPQDQAIARQIVTLWQTGGSDLFPGQYGRGNVPLTEQQAAARSFYPARAQQIAKDETLSYGFELPPAQQAAKIAVIQYEEQNKASNDALVQAGYYDAIERRNFVKARQIAAMTPGGAAYVDGLARLKEQVGYPRVQMAEDAYKAANPDLTTLATNRAGFTDQVLLGYFQPRPVSETAHQRFVYQEVDPATSKALIDRDNLRNEEFRQNPAWSDLYDRYTALSDPQAIGVFRGAYPDLFAAFAAIDRRVRTDDGISPALVESQEQEFMRTHPDFGFDPSRQRATG